MSETYERSVEEELAMYKHQYQRLKEINALIEEENAKLTTQLDELIGVVFEHCNAHSAPYTLAEAIEWGNGQ